MGSHARRRACLHPAASGWLGALVWWVIGLAALRGVEAQETRVPTLAEAMARRDAGDLSTAAQMLRARLGALPHDGDALRLLAQLTYWLGDRTAARDLYETALQRHPTDTAVRLDYGQMLVETLAAARARQVLLPLARGGSGAARASTLLGRLAWWSADLRGARSHFRAALELDPRAAEASAALRDIALATSPWVQFEGRYLSDDQPVTQGRGGGEVGWFPTPNWSIAMGGALARLADDVVTPRHVGEAFVRARGFVPAARVNLDAQLGVHRRSYSVPGSVVGGAAIRAHLRPGLKLRGRIERLPYLHTASSLDSAVVPLTIDGALQLESRTGWEGEMALQRQAFVDDNDVTTAYAWLLAPVARGPRVTLKLGYAFSAQDADSTRFVLVDPTGASLAGRFVPYFTPDDIVGHHALAALVIGAAGSTTFRLDGRYGVRVTDVEPTFGVAPGPPGQSGVRLEYRDRAFHPGEIRALLDLRTGPRFSIRVAGEYWRTVYYERSEVSVALVHRLGRSPAPAASR